MAGEDHPESEDAFPVDVRVERAVLCVCGLVLEGNAGFEEELRSLLIEIVTDPRSAVLIADLADALAEPSASFGNHRGRLLDRFILHIDTEIALEASRSHQHAEAKAGFWTFLTGGTLGLGVGVSVAPLWMAATGPFAPWVAGGLLATSAMSYWRRRVSSHLEDAADNRKRGLESLRSAIERRL